MDIPAKATHKLHLYFLIKRALKVSDTKGYEKIVHGLSSRSITAQFSWKSSCFTFPFLSNKSKIVTGIDTVKYFYFGGWKEVVNNQSSSQL